ncbi:MAG: DUF4270 domain-containing protein [Dysgonamonadaceae bacterium]|jgi:hypothetical protein|nr:DUF4270 domain-containing protein [Dysgonamonadaceae bacterium]
MKLKAIIYSIFISLAFVACDDELSSVGMGVQPENDRMSVRTDTINTLTSSTVSLDSIFIKANTTYLGNFDDPHYGNIKYSFLTNFYTSPNDVFPDDVIDDKIDSVTLRVFYYGFAGKGFVGDSLAPMGATVREVLKPLGKNFYSNLDPEKAGYIKRNIPAWADTVYTARNMNMSDSAYFLGQFRSVDFKLPNHVGERIYNEWKKPGGKETFKDLDKFFEFFKGVYVESTYGSGSILIVQASWLEVHYDTHVMLKDKDGKDSVEVVRPARTLFSTASEATQLNIIDKAKSEESDKQLIANTDFTFLKTPSGVVTELKIPLRDIVDIVGENRIFNNVNLTLDVEDRPIWEYPLPIPPRVLLISPDSVKPFFEEARVANSSYSYYAGLTTSSAFQYDFGNISNLIQSSIRKKEVITPQDTLKLWVIPVEIGLDGQTPITTTHLFTPSGAKLPRKNLKLSITTTRTNR